MLQNNKKYYNAKYRHVYATSIVFKNLVNCCKTS